jgi:hypothetical protein
MRKTMFSTKFAGHNVRRQPIQTSSQNSLAITHVDWEQQRQKVAEIKDNTVSVRSRGVYQNSYTRFIAWIVINKPSLVYGSFAARMGPGASAKHIEDVRAATVKDIIAELEKRAIGAGTVTFDGLHDALKQCLQAGGVTELLNKLNAGPHQALVQEVNGEDEMPHPAAHFWDGRFRRVPPDFDLPDCSVAMLWWQCGDASKKIPPLRVLDGRDMPNRNLARLLCGDAVVAMRRC